MGWYRRCLGLEKHYLLYRLMRMIELFGLHYRPPLISRGERGAKGILSPSLSCVSRVHAPRFFVIAGVR